MTSAINLPTASRKSRNWPFRILIAAIALVSLWIRMAFPVVAIAAPHDDFLFISLANSILQGQWLGAYNNLTHAKGVAYPVFLAGNHLLGLPLKLTEQALYLGSALYLANVLGRVCKSRWIVIVTFLLLAINPASWSPVVGGRVVREGLYAIEVLLLFALAVRCFVERDGDSVPAELTRKKYSLVALGLVGGAFWLTREEGIWMLPTLCALAGYWLLARIRQDGSGNKRVMLLYLLTPVAMASLPVFAINSLNYVHYGVFRNNDFRSSDFVKAYGALSRIKHADWRRYVVFPKDARDRAYEFSPAARELRPFFEGEFGKAWRAIGCSQTRTDPCPEILSGWFMWALRDAVQAAGHYETATKAAKYYRRLAAEINQACLKTPDVCFPERNTLAPPWRQHYAADALFAGWRIARTLATLYGLPVATGNGLGSAEQMALFERITGERIDIRTVCPISGCPEFAALQPSGGKLRYRLAQALAGIERDTMRIGLPLSMLWLMLCVPASIWRRRIPVAVVISGGLAIAILTRVTLLGFLEVTSIPSDNMLYLSPLVPLALALITVAGWGLWGAAKDAKAKTSSS